MRKSTPASVTRKLALTVTLVSVGCLALGVIGGKWYFSRTVSPQTSVAVEPEGRRPTLPSLVPQQTQPRLSEDIVDSNMSLQAALSGSPVPEGIKANLALVSVDYWSFDNRVHEGQVVVDKDVAAEVKDIFREIKEAHFPIDRVIPIVKYGWSDEDSMDDDNTSGFNFRNIHDQKALSKHALGLAIDINPRLNPCVRDNEVQPTGAEYDPEAEGTVTADGPVVAAFKRYGWKWGGRWHKFKDWQHFEKPDGQSAFASFTPYRMHLRPQRT